MANWLAQLFGTPQPQNLDDIRASGKQFELVPSDGQTPDYLVAHGEISGTPSLPTMDVNTAIILRNDEFEFTTNIGQVPDTTLGLAITNVLNHHINGKFVNFPDDKHSSTDIVYVTQQPITNLTFDSLNKELENHATVKVLVSPVILEANKQDQTSASQNIFEVAQNIVRANLVSGLDDSQNQYTPLPFNPPTDKK